MEELTKEIEQELMNATGDSMVSLFCPRIGCNETVRRGVRKMEDMVSMLRERAEDMRNPKVPEVPEDAEPVAAPEAQPVAAANLEALATLMEAQEASHNGYACFAVDGKARCFTPLVPIRTFLMKVDNKYYLEPLEVKPAGIMGDGLDHSDHVCISTDHPSLCHFEMLLDDLLHPDAELLPKEVAMRTSVIAAIKRMQDKITAFNNKG